MVNFKELSNNTHPQWFKDPGMRKGFIHLIILYCAVYSLGYDGSLLAGLQALPAWQEDFDHPKGTKLGLIAATYYFPKLPGTIALAWVADRYGRKAVAYVSGVFMLAGAIFGGLAQNVGQLIGSRIFLGLGTAGAMLSAATLVPELAHPRVRAKAGGFLTTFFYVGSIFAAWLTFAMVFEEKLNDWTWRIPTFVQGFGPLLFLVLMYWVPESPRWLIAKGREEQAHKILADYHANGKLDDELVMFELREIKVGLELEKRAKTTGWMAFLATPGNRRRLAIIILLAVTTQFAGNGVVQYYIVPILRSNGITSPTQLTSINGGLSIFCWFVSMAGASTVEKFGRRPLFLASIVGMLVCFIIITGTSGAYASTKDKATGLVIVPMVYLFMASYSLAMTPLPALHAGEINPTPLRAKGLAIYIFTQNLTQTFNQFVNPVALAAIAWKYYFVYVGILVFYLFAFYYAIRETRGLTVEEAATVYDDEHVRADMAEQERKMRLEAEAAVLGSGDSKSDSKAASVEEIEYKV
ncbi:hypothetical protein OIO90_004240 [Microbotryomycetes sp. JL221]|nr:hypothetical protein OIO90_004240 [Microbotryomycetes sp. JL221]